MPPFQDNLSSLPDELVFQIISFLPFKEAVRTSVLATRWRFVAPGIKNLEFREGDFVAAQENPDVDDDTRETQRRDFINFVLRWISKAHPGTWKNFSIAFSNPKGFLVQLLQCIQFAIDRSVEVFDVDFSNPEWDQDDVQTQYDHFQSAIQLPLIQDGDLPALKTLKLCSCYFPTWANDFSLLRSVTLGWIEVTSSGMCSMLEKCASLETLWMRNCCYSGSVEIISESLRSLVMEKCRSADGPDSTLYLTIDAPEMESFCYSGVLFTLCCNSLNLDMDAALDFGLQAEFGELGDILYEILHNIGGVRSLTVCTYMLQVIPLGEEPYQMRPRLERLQHLTLKASLSEDEFYGISFFLKSCPNLEVLTIDLNTCPRVFEDYDAPSDIRYHPFYPNPYMTLVYVCMKKKLKKIVVEGFRGTTNEIVVLRYLLQHSKVLQTLHITISTERDSDGNSLEEVYIARAYSLLQLKKANQRLQILLSRNA